MSEKIRVLIVDDHPVVLEGLKGLFEREPDIEVVATARSGDELLDLLRRHRVDVVVLDLQMPYHGLVALAEIRRRRLPVRVLVLTAFDDDENIRAALELQVEGFVSKTQSPRHAIAAIRQIAGGHLVYPRAARRWLAVRAGTGITSAAQRLSPREWEVLSYVAQGLTNAEIAAQLMVSENTVRFHLKNIYEKLHVANRTEATAWYLQHQAPGAESA
ncbi:MAG: response regulator transcription factor [Ardenticatenia bacterium]|nr:response regulator transcription factor [Ardenticatenia bacterium]